jgi:hypothetical protein
MIKTSEMYFKFFIVKIIIKMDSIPIFAKTMLGTGFSTLLCSGGVWLMAKSSAPLIFVKSLGFLGITICGIGILASSLQFY